MLSCSQFYVLQKTAAFPPLLQYRFTKHHSNHFFCKQAGLESGVSDKIVRVLRSDDKKLEGKNNQENYYCRIFIIVFLYLMPFPTKSKTEEEIEKTQ